MSILIKGVEMPKSCEECQVCDYEEGNCLLTGTNRISDGRNTLPHNGERRDWCPLIEIPPHGRLIDADALIKEWKLGFYRRIVEALMEDAPTIIEAERRKNNETF